MSGPSGAGKSSIVRNLLERLDLDFSVSATTRDPRPGEVDGRHYSFVTGPEFEKMIQAGQLLEWARYNGNYYGTLAAPIAKSVEAGRDIILEIEIQGARQIRRHRPDAVMFFIIPPTMAELSERLRSRGDTPETDVESRLAIAESEIEDALAVFDHIVVNDVLERATAEIEGLIMRPDEVALGSP